MRKPPFTLTMPVARTSPVVFASPHSGREYPRSFRRASMLGSRSLRSSEDAFVDLLFEAAPVHGAPLLCANFPRAYLDTNRGAGELDPALIRGVEATALNPRIASGLGVIPRVVSGGRAIYRGKITLADAQTRIRDFWHPYHSALARLLDDGHALFGRSVLVDCHSMPHEAIQNMSPLGSGLPEIVLGDRFGAACSAAIVDRIEQAFTAAGLKVARNKPFAGAYISQRYGLPSRDQHAVQIEIDRALYMDEDEIRTNRNFNHLKSLLDTIIAEISIADGKEHSLAAE